MKLLKNKELIKGEWLNLLEKSEYSSPFQTMNFYDFFNSVDGLIADVFAIEEGGEYKSLVVITIQKEEGIKGLFSKRGIIYGGPVINEGNDIFIKPLLEGVNRYYKKKLIYIEIRNFFDYSLIKKQFIQAGFNYVPWLNFHLDCADLVSMKKAISSSRKRQVKKAIENGAKLAEAKSKDDVISFYNILSDLYKNKVRKPLFSVDFFVKFYKQNFGKYFLVYYEGKVIGGIMCLLLPNKIIYEFYVCGLDIKYKKQHPSICATWAAMEYANQNNIPLFDFMGAGSPDEEYGVREFKSRFGGQQVENGRFICIFNPLMYKIGYMGIKLLSAYKFKFLV